MKTLYNLTNLTVILQLNVKLFQKKISFHNMAGHVYSSQPHMDLKLFQIVPSLDENTLYISGLVHFH